MSRQSRLRGNRANLKPRTGPTAGSRTSEDRVKRIPLILAGEGLRFHVGRRTREAFLWIEVPASGIGEAANDAVIVVAEPE